MPGHFFENWKGSIFVKMQLRSKVSVDPRLPIFYRDILSFLVQIKRQLKQEDEQDIIFFIFLGMVYKRNYLNKGSPTGEWTISYL